jgi:hypothetical protein
MTRDHLLSDWDDELDVVAGEIAHLRGAHGKTRLTGDKAIVAKRVAIVQAQIELDRSYERIRKLTQRDFMLLPRERALVHWASLYLEAATKVFALTTKIGTRNLWLRLVRTRLASPGTRDAAGEDLDHEEQEDLASLAVRQANLAKTEGFLAEALARLRERKTTLTRRYHALGVVDANHAAGGSLGTRLGPTPADALRSPTVRALEDYFRLVTAPIHSRDAAHRWKEAERRAAKRADGLLGMCKTVVAQRLKEPEKAPVSKPPSRVMDKFQAALEQLDALEAETRAAYGQILGVGSEPTPPNAVARPPETR